MDIQRAYKTELKINNKQRTALLKHAGTARYAYNWGLNRVQSKVSKPNAIQLHKEWNQWKRENAPWWEEVSKCSPQEALRDLERAFKNFFRGCKEGKKIGFPKFKSKNKGIGGFRLTGTIRVFDDAIQLPVLGRLKLKEHGYIPTDKHILSATISEQAGRWFVSVLVNTIVLPQETTGEVLGIDLGVKTLATCSDGTKYNNPKALSKYEKKIKRLQRHMMKRQQKGSHRRKKTQRQIANLWMRIANIRKDAVQKATSEIVKTKRPTLIVFEDLSIREMVKDRSLAKSVHDAAMRKFRTTLEYKQVWAGGEIGCADRYYPSSKTCSKCGYVKEDLTLEDRVYSCYNCGGKMDRDLNAAINLSRWSRASSARIEGQGEAKVHDASQVSFDEMSIKQEVA
jgi:putative transposase